MQRLPEKSLPISSFTVQTLEALATPKVPSPAWRYVGAVSLVFALLFCGYLAMTPTILNNADNAGIVLEAQAMRDGNLTLHQWYLPLDSFITSEIPLYAIGSVFFPLSALMHIIPAFLLAALVCGSLVLTRQMSQPREHQWINLLACFALVGLPIGSYLDMLLQGPMHVMTIVLSLGAFWCFDRIVHTDQPRRWLALLAYISTLSIIGDPLAEVLIPIPIGIVAISYLVRTHGASTIARALCGVAAGSLAAGLLLQRLLYVFGTHIDINNSSAHLARPETLGQHLEYLVDGLGLIFHIDLRSSWSLDVQLLPYLLCGAVAILCIVGTVRLFWHHFQVPAISESLPAVMGWAIVGNIAAFVLTNFIKDITNIRYLLPSMCYLAMLFAASLRTWMPPRFVRYVVLLYAISSLVLMIGAIATRPVAHPPEAQLVRFLTAQHLSDGYGSYWSANIITVQSDQRIRVRPVDAINGSIQPRFWHETSEWFHPQPGRAPHFLVYERYADSSHFFQAALQTFGNPDHMYHISFYTVLIWDQPIPLQDWATG